MNYIDIIILIPVAWMAYVGFRRGFIIELASLVGFIAGIYAVIHYTPNLERFLFTVLDLETKYISVISFILIFIVVVGFVYFLGKILENIISIIALGIVNKLIGVVFGVLKAVIFMSILITLLNLINADIISEDKRDKSVFYKPVSKLAPYIWKKLNEMEVIRKNNIIEPDSFVNAEV